MPKVSVIVPVYKDAEFLRSSIDSILKQTFCDFELILVSDGPFEVHNICEELAKSDSRIKLIKNICKGLGGARNAALKIAKGEYISFVDGDDTLNKDAIKKALDVYDKNDVDLVIFDTNFVDECKDTEQRRSEAEYISLKYDGLIDEINREHIFSTNVHAWNKLWRKDIIDKYNIVFPENVPIEDFPFYFKYIFASKKVFYLKEKLYNYFRYDNSSMAKIYNKSPFKDIKIHITSCEFLYNELQKDDLFEQNKNLFIELFDRWVSIALFHSKEKDIYKIKELAYQTILKLKLDISQAHNLCELKRKLDRHKTIFVMGIRIKIKRRSRERV